MSARFLTLGAVLLVAACSADMAEEVHAINTYSDFDAVDTRALPAGFTVASGRWEVVEDSTAPSGGQALAQLSKDGSAGFNVILIEESNRQDIDLTVSIRSIAGEIDQGGGPVWRAQDANNYYIARYNPLEDNYRVYVVIEGSRKQLQSVDIDHSSGWHTLRITMTGDLIRCFYDGEQQLEVEDSSFAEAGKIGLWTKADAQTHFDDLKLN